MFVYSCWPFFCVCWLVFLCVCDVVRFVLFAPSDTCASAVDDTFDVLPFKWSLETYVMSKGGQTDRSWKSQLRFSRLFYGGQTDRSVLKISIEFFKTLLRRTDRPIGLENLNCVFQDSFTADRQTNRSWKSQLRFSRLFYGGQTDRSVLKISIELFRFSRLSTGRKTNRSSKSQYDVAFNEN